MKKLHLAGLLVPAFLVLIALVLAWKNFTPGTFLIGWDSLHPEFNFPLAFQRAFWGVWRAEQGVGAIAAHAHMADIPRIFFLWLAHFVLPAWSLRYFYIFTCLAAGPLGVYFFAKYILEREKTGLSVILASFLGGAFYLLNLITLQHFYVPFEMFTTAYGLTPWLFLAAIRFLREGKKSQLIGFGILTVLSSPAAYAPTLYYAYLGCLFVFLFVYSLLSKFNKVFVKRGAAIALLALVLNSYWILPNVYSLINQSQIIENAKINRLFSPEALLRSQDYANLKDVALGKSFLFSWRAFDFSKGSFSDLLGNWQGHLRKEGVVAIGYLFAATAALGAILSLLKRNKPAVALALSGLFSLFFLLNTNYPLKILQEALRMPFTKFSIQYLFALSVFVAVFWAHIFNKLGLLKVLAAGVLLGGLIYFALPAFQGELIDKSLQRVLPQEYFQAFSWFDANPAGRIAKLPMNSLWGWNYRDWGYEGSGFLTYGISNSVLDRDFDRWTPYNESFYNEASNALYAQDLEAFEKALEKYRVRYLLLDESIVNAGGDKRILYIPETKETLSVSDHISNIRQFGALTIYKTDFEAGKDDILAPKTYTKDAKTLMSSDMVEAFKPLLGSPDIIEDLSRGRGFARAVNCDLLKIGTVGKKHTEGGIEYTADSGGVSCDFLEYPEIAYNESFLLRVKGQNPKGRSLKIYLYNTTTGRMDLEELLPKGSFDEYYFVPAKKMAGKGYTLNLETRSFGKIASENILTGVEIYKVPKNVDTSISIDTDNISTGNNLTIKEVKKITPVLYQVKAEGAGVLQLSQGYEPGWVALKTDSKEIQKLTHFQINGWANGWETEDTSTILIFFWPQVLEFLGILAGVIALTILVKKT